MRTVEFEGRWYVYDGDVQVQGPFDGESEAAAWIEARRQPDERSIRG